MKLYFDPLTPGNVPIEQDTQLYIIKSGEEYVVRGISSGLEELAADPQSQVDTGYWRIEDAEAFINAVEKASLTPTIFPNNTLTLSPLPRDIITQCTSIDLHSAPTPFSGKANHEATATWEQDETVNMYLIEEVRIIFATKIMDLYGDKLLAAAADFRDNPRTSSKKTIHLLKEINLTEEEQNRIIHPLLNLFPTKDRKELDAFFTPLPQYPTHVHRFSEQIDFDSLLEECEERLRNRSSITHILQRLQAHPAVAPQHTPHADEQEQHINNDQLALAIEQDIYDFVKQHFFSLMDEDNIDELETAWGNYAENGTNARHEALMSLNISNEDQNEFLAELERDYDLEPDSVLLGLANSYFTLTDEKPTHAALFDGLVDFSSILAAYREAIPRLRA
jgi:hypothetical protein